MQLRLASDSASSCILHPKWQDDRDVPLYSPGDKMTINIELSPGKRVMSFPAQPERRGIISEI